MTGRKNRFPSLFSGNTQSAKSDSTASTSSPQKIPDYAKKIREAAEALDKETVGADLDTLLDYISRLSDFIMGTLRGSGFHPRYSYTHKYGRSFPSMTF